jgi:hypothetical protein
MEFCGRFRSLIGSSSLGGPIYIFKKLQPNGVEMLRKILGLFTLLTCLQLNVANAGLTVSDQLAAVFQSSTPTVSTRMSWSGAANDDGTFANLLAPGDVVEMVFAFSGTLNGDPDYAALVFRATGSSESFHFVSGGNLASQKTVFAAQEGFQYSPDTLALSGQNGAGASYATGSNNVAYLLTSDTYNFAGKSISQISSEITSNSSVNLVASYQLDTGSTLQMDALIGTYTGTDTAGSGSIEINYTMNLVQTSILTAEASNFSTIDGSLAAIVANPISSKITGSFDSTDTTHVISAVNTSLQFATTFAVPEPSSLAMLSLVGLMGAMSKRRRK